jgi:hypothetical protein
LGDKSHFTRDFPEGKWVPKDLLTFVPTNPPAKRAEPPPKGAACSIPVESGDHVQEFKVKWSRTKKFCPEPIKVQVLLHWQPIERMHDFHMVGTLAFIRHCVLTLTISAHQSFLCFVLSFSAAIPVPHSVCVRW